MNERINSLIDILLDKSAREDERHDAALYLFEYDSPEVLNAFYQIGKDPNELHILLEAAGEGIGEIWSKLNIFDSGKLALLTNISRNNVLSIIKVRNPKLVTKGF